MRRIRLGGLGACSPREIFWKFNAPRGLLRHFLGLKASLESLHFSPDHMHVDWCPSASAVSGTPVEPGEEVVQQKPVNILLLWILLRAAPDKNVWPLHSQSACSQVLQFSFTLGLQVRVGTNLWWQYACFSTASKGLATSSQSKHWLYDCRVC